MHRWRGSLSVPTVLLWRAFVHSQYPFPFAYPRTTSFSGIFPARRSEGTEFFVRGDGGWSLISKSGKMLLMHRCSGTRAPTVLERAVSRR
ncbi:hypothetical protein ARMGADRAFT_727256 [Armillaria gallica]|uniref:Secreted protein n=1 Tax=Armillaria gallica TaxID=47427 RepID=A0A2H3DSM9_ARMGA|nr:hypothetical protein ARMGADRAFT_727256 [Armillaria gallica]